MGLLLALAQLAPGAAPAPAHASDARMSARLDPAELPLGQTARLSVTISGVQAAPAPRIPAIDGLVVRSLGQTTSVQIVNGRVSSEVIHNFIVEPTRTGAFTIPALSVRVGGETVATTPLSLRVLDAGAIPRTRTGPPPAGGGRGGAEPNPLWLQLESPDRELYVGELIPVKLKLYVREGVRVTEVMPPAFEGSAFTVTRPSDEQPQQSTEVVDGIRYVTVTFPLAISPVTAGTHALTGKVDVTAYLPGRRRLGGVLGDSFFDSFFGGGGAQRRIPVASAPRTVRVSSLPSEGRPADFSGAIGRFRISAAAKPKKVAVGDPVTLEVEVSGEGNFDRLTLPALETDPAWKAYPPSSRFTPGDSLGYTGRKVFEQALVPQRVDVATVPSRELSYFDPEARRYVTTRTQPVALEVFGGAGPPALAGPGGRPAGTSGEPAGPAALELAPNQVVLGPLVEDTGPIVGRAWFVAVQALPVLALVAGFAWSRRRERLHADADYQRRRAARRRVEVELAALERALAQRDTGAFFGAARRALQQSLASKPDASAESLTLAEMEALLASSPALRDEVRAVVGQADAITYSGAGLDPAALTAWRDRIVTLLAALGRSSRRR